MHVTCTCSVQPHTNLLSNASSGVGIALQLHWARILLQRNLRCMSNHVCDSKWQYPAQGEVNSPSKSSSIKVVDARTLSFIRIDSKLCASCGVTWDSTVQLAELKFKKVCKKMSID